MALLLSTMGEDHCNTMTTTSSPSAPPTLLLLLLALAKFHARPGDLDRSKGALLIVKPSIGSRVIFGGGSKEGGGWRQITMTTATIATIIMAMMEGGGSCL